VGFEIKILGGVDASIDGRLLPVGGPKQRAVLAMLALRANRTVSVEELIDGLWGDRPPPSARNNIQLYVSRLRKALGDDGAARIVTHASGYQLMVPDDAVDAARFEQLVERAGGEVEDGRGDGTAQDALRLWQGTPLADIADEPFAGPEIRRLEELHLRATELAIDLELAAGRHREVLATLESLLTEHPLHERFHSQRMLALYRAGRQSEAMNAYRRASRALIDAIGAGPGPELRELADAIARQDPSLAPPPPRIDLPAPLEAGSPLLAGREHELRWLRARWADAEGGRPQVALIGGPHGIGKTSIAGELAGELQGGGVAVLYAAGARSPEIAAAAIRDARESDRATLLVLDDADEASPALLGSASALVAEPRGNPLLVLVLHRDEAGPPAFGDASQRLVLRPLRAAAAAEIAALYAPGEDDAVPVDTLMAEGEGIPLRIHRAASSWAQAQAAERLETRVGRASSDRGDLRAAEAEVAATVGDLQATRERTDLYLVEEPSGPTSEVCPFRGLAPFDSAHADYFFGRERLVADLLARLVGSTLIAVVGPSGSGKSSVIRAGLLPALADGVLPGSKRWRQVLLRPGGQPTAELGRALAGAVGGSDGRRLEMDDLLAAAVDGLKADERLVLAVDQVEEILTACRDKLERIRFVDAVLMLADDPDRRAVVILGIRGDFYGRFAEFPELATRMGASTVLVGPMRREELRRAIELPARRAGLRVEPALVSALAGNVAEEPGGLPLLSTTLVELWQRRSGRTLRRATYDATGGVSGAVARLAERAYERLSQPQRERARAILLRLADAEQPTPVRRRVPLAELATDRGEDAAALAVLTESRLVTADGGTVEVAHEALLREWPRLRAWLEEDVEGRRLHQHLIHAAAEWGGSERDPAELYRGARLASALGWADSHYPQLNAIEREFLEASSQASEREAERQRRTNRRLRTLLAGLGALLAIAVVAGVVAISQRQSAREAARTEAAQRLGAEAINERQLDQALRLASAAVVLDDSVATRSSLLSVLQRSPETVAVLNGAGEELWALALSPDGRTLALGDTSGRVFLYDAQTHERIGEHQWADPEAISGQVTALEFDPSGERLAIAGREPPNGWTGRLEVIDVASLEVRATLELGSHPGTRLRNDGTAAGRFSYFPTATWTPDGRGLIVGYPGDPSAEIPMFLRRFDLDREAPVGRASRIAPRSSGFAGVHQGPHGRLLYPGDRATYAVDAEALRVDRRYPVGGMTAAISVDGKTLAVGAEDGTMRLLDPGSGRVKRLRGRHGAPVVSIAFSPDGRTLASGGEDGRVTLWSASVGRSIEVLDGHDGPIFSQAFSPDGATLYTASVDATARAWDVAGERRLARAFTTGISPIPEEGFPPAFAISPDGATVAAARFDGRVDLIDADALRRTQTFEAFGRTPATAIEYAPDGRSLAIAGGRGLTGVWDPDSGRRIGPLLDSPHAQPCADPRSMFEIPRCHDRTVQHALAFGPGVLAAASIGGRARIWDVDTQEPIQEPLKVRPFTLGLDFSPDGSRLAIPFGFANPGTDGVEIYDARSGDRIATVVTEDEVRTVSFSPDGRVLAAGQTNGEVTLWATTDWRQVGSPLALGGGFVLWVEFSPDGRTLATAGDDGRIALWEVESREPIGPPLPAIANAWVTARFTPDGSHLFALYETGHAVRWPIDPSIWMQHACTVAGGGLSPEQWDRVVPDQDYVRSCPAG
jgi:WD40 repeat protein/DNA-binding SARP family transcriptional activator